MTATDIHSGYLQPVVVEAKSVWLGWDTTAHRRPKSKSAVEVEVNKAPLLMISAPWSCFCGGANGGEAGAVTYSQGRGGG
jgi:hypothetical protein